eukprot:4318983-Amphidinium_carterae.1
MQARVRVRGQMWRVVDGNIGRDVLIFPKHSEGRGAVHGFDVARSITDVCIGHARQPFLLALLEV